MAEENSEENPPDDKHGEADLGFGKVDASKFKFSKHQFSGQILAESVGKQEEVKGKSIKKMIEKFKAKPQKYLAMQYQSNMIDWPKSNQAYKVIYRQGTNGFKPQNLDVDPKAWMTLLLNTYQALPSFPNNQLPEENRDKYTDDMMYAGRMCHSSKNPPILPGRGMGCVDQPNIKIIGDVDPSDIAQGTVGDCWLLSSISSLAEFDGAVKKLFRKTKDLDNRPHEEPNMYTVTLWDLETWKQVDIEIDERLPALPDGTGQLLASRPSKDGELWVCYLEKAIACHVGGWDKLQGGQCIHGWSMMTGCKHQYTIRINEETGLYACFMRYCPYEERWGHHTNSPHTGEKMVWRNPWPEVGGGGDAERELTKEELFEKMVAWDEHNYIVAAAVSSKIGKPVDGGLVQNHAYSVIEAHKNVAGTDIDLLKVRNPWGTGEIEDGMFDDDGPGWEQYPQIKKELNPVVADDGIFYVTKEEFFKMYDVIYLSASDMTRFKED